MPLVNSIFKIWWTQCTWRGGTKRFCCVWQCVHYGDVQWRLWLRFFPEHLFLSDQDVGSWSCLQIWCSLYGANGPYDIIGMHLVRQLGQWEGMRNISINWWNKAYNCSFNKFPDLGWYTMWCGVMWICWGIDGMDGAPFQAVAKWMAVCHNTKIVTNMHMAATITDQLNWSIFPHLLFPGSILLIMI